MQSTSTSARVKRNIHQSVCGLYIARTMFISNRMSSSHFAELCLGGSTIFTKDTTKFTPKQGDFLLLGDVGGCCGSRFQRTKKDSECWQIDFAISVPTTDCCSYFPCCFKTTIQTHRINAWYIYLHLVDFNFNCRVNIPYRDSMGDGFPDLTDTGSIGDSGFLLTNQIPSTCRCMRPAPCHLAISREMPRNAPLLRKSTGTDDT